MPPSLSGLLASDAEVADEGRYGASSYGSGEGRYGSGGQSGSDKDFKFVCINNNNNTVVGGGKEQPIPEPPDLACEECFAVNSTLQRIIIDFLSMGDPALTVTSFTEDNSGQLIVDVVAVGGQINTIEKLCNELEKSTEFLGVPISDETIRNLLFNIIFILSGSPEDFKAGIEQLIDCLLEKGIIVDRDFGPGSLSVNGLSNPNVQVATFGLN